MHQDQLDRRIASLRFHRNDDSSTEVKACAKELGASAWESVVAFANTSGGVLILGLEAPDFTPVADFDIDRVRDQFITGMGDGGQQSKLTNPPRYSIDRLEVDHKPVLAITIEENPTDAKPAFVTAKGIATGAFKRIDDKDVRLSSTEIFELQHAQSPSTADRAPVPETSIADLDPEAIARLVEQRRNSKALRGATSVDEQLQRLNIIDSAKSVRLAGLLTLGNYPQQHFPRLLVDVTVHPTNEKSAPNTDERFVDRTLCEGRLAEVVDEAVNAVARNLRTHSIMKGTSRRERLEIPIAVLREAIANAVVHREYAPIFQGQVVSVDIHPDRVVVTSPGGLWGGKTIQNLDDGTSRCRNQTLMQILQQSPLPDNGGMTVEGQGGGVRLMVREMEANALDRPTFRATADQVTVQLNRHGAELAEHQEWIHRQTSRPLSAHESAILALARREGEVRVSEVHRIIGVDSDDARELLGQLRADGLLREVAHECYALPVEMPLFEARSEASSSTDTQVLAKLSATEPMTIHDLADGVGKTPGALRPSLRRLIRDGRVVATAPPTSRNRKYIRVPRP